LLFYWAKAVGRLEKQISSPTIVVVPKHWYQPIVRRSAVYHPAFGTIVFITPALNHARHYPAANSFVAPVAVATTLTKVAIKYMWIGACAIEEMINENPRSHQATGIYHYNQIVMD
jgi:hypothetical protein